MMSWYGNRSSWSEMGHSGAVRVIVERSGSSWSSMSHSGAERVISNKRLVLELTPVQAVQARLPGCRSRHIVQ